MKNIEIIKNSKKYIAGSLTAMAIMLAVLIFNVVSGNGAFNLDVEFSGGTSIVIDMGQPVDVAEVETLIGDSVEGNKLVRNYEGSNEIEIKLQETDSVIVESVVDKVLEKYGLTNAAIVSTYSFSPSVSKEMQTNAVLALIVACGAILIYVGIRFKDFIMGASSICALIHDIMFIVLFYSVTRIPLNYSFIAVLLTIVGYSINATIVIFDRARENKLRRPSMDEGELMNMSINQTVTRSIYTSITTLLAIFFLFVFGVDSMQQFALPIIFGIAIGTYSSVFISGSIWYSLRNMKANREVKEKSTTKA